MGDWIEIDANKAPAALPGTGEPIDLLMADSRIIEGAVGYDGIEAWWFEDRAGDLLNVDNIKAWRPAQSDSQQSIHRGESGQ